MLAVGPNVQTAYVGQTVGILRCAAGVTVWGTLAEKTVVPAASLAPVPPGWNEKEMAAAPLVFLTSWQALTQWSEPSQPPEPGKVLLVRGRLRRCTAWTDSTEWFGRRWRSAWLRHPGKSASRPNRHNQRDRLSARPAADSPSIVAAAGSAAGSGSERLREREVRSTP